jgi:hypothetical protein
MTPLPPPMPGATQYTLLYMQVCHNGGSVTSRINTEAKLKYVSIYSPYRAVNTLLSVIKTSQLMLYREITAVCSGMHTEHINTLCGKNVEFLMLK